MSNVYLKLQQVRNELRKQDLKKTGENKFSKYMYYQLGDFLPVITDLCDKHKLVTIINFTQELATLTVIDAEKPEKEVTFTSQVAGANLKGCHEVQNLGAIQTYLRRYLYMNAFEIVENDWVDEGTAKKEELDATKVKTLYTIATKFGYTRDLVHKTIKKKYNLESTKNLTIAQFKEMCDGMEKNPIKGDK